jgi:hypothetical protein
MFSEDNPAGGIEVVTKLYTIYIIHLLGLAPVGYLASPDNGA